MQKTSKITGMDFLYCIVGCSAYAVAVRVFLSENAISPGGITGCAVLIGTKLHLPIGLLILLFNLPIVLLGWRSFGHVFILKTAVATAILSGCMTVAEWLLPALSVNTMLAALSGGALMGFGIGLVLYRGASTGGVDILAKWMHQHFASWTVGRSILVFDAGVILLNALVYRNLETALYSAVAITVSARMTDALLAGADRGKLIYIVSVAAREIGREIGQELERGGTILAATGVYTQQERTVLLCVVRRQEIGQVYRIIRRLDAKAFVAVSDVGEILGEGFKNFGSL